MKKKIILIGGMPTVGKTTIAKQVSRNLHLPYISTDQIRIIMQSVADHDKYPLLFNAAGYSAEDFLEKYTAEEIAAMEYEQGNEMRNGIKHFIENDWVWKDGFVIEGVNILPSLVSELSKKSLDISAIFLSDTNPERIRKVVYERGLYGDAKTYSDHVKDKEVEWVKIFDEMIRRNAMESGQIVVDVSKDHADIENAMKLLS